jgi:hypothetical protein
MSSVEVLVLGRNEISRERTSAKPGLALTLLVSSILMQIGFAAFELVSTLLPVLRAGSWDELDDPASSFHIPNFRAAIMGNVVCNAMLIIVLVYALVLFRKRARSFAGFTIFALIFHVAIVLGAMAFGNRIDAEYPVFTADNITELTRAAMMLVIWVPYLLLAPRVKTVFVRNI